MSTIDEIKPGFSSEKESSAYAAAQYRQFFGRGDNRYAIFPDYWQEGWGKPPYLGIVTADNEFLAERLAFDRGILNPHNCSFQPKIKLLGQSRKI